MPNVFKVTYIFSGREVGWTESYWLQGANNDHSKQVASVVTLAKARAICLSKPCKIKGYRISLDDTGPDALLEYDEFRPKEVNLGNDVVIKFDDACEPDVSLLVRCSNATQSRHKHIFMRGIPDDIEKNNGEYQRTAAWKLAFNNFANTLTVGVWGWMGVDAAARVSKVGVVNVEEAAGGTTTFTFKSDLFPAGLDANKPVKVRISGVNKKSPANGTHIVYPVDRRTAVTVNALAPGKYHFGGKAAYAPLTFITIENVQDQKIVERHAGAPLLPSRGRAPARARG